MKKTLILAVAAMATLGASAELLSPAQALTRAVEQLPASSSARRAMRAAAVSAEPLMTVAAHSAQPELYVFANPGALMLVSAESETPALLGYSANYAPGNELPPSLAALMRTYAAEIAATRVGDVIMAGAGSSRADFAAIEPICKTTWNQDAPYNDQSPLLGTAKTFTGCVATAMAQVLKVIEYPAKCSGGTFSYSWYNGSTTLSINFDDVTLDWANMLNRYTNSSSAASRTAVATLMKACGYAAEMNFGTDGSGAQSFNMAKGLVRNFGISPAMRYLLREWFSLAEWQQLVYDELAAGRAVYYDGHTIDNAGHAFVVDGYQADGYFHLNWGWGGMSDGYFLLSALDPASQGIGGSTGGFDVLQGAMLNVVPDTGVDRNTVDLSFFSQGAFTCSSSNSVTLGNNATFNYAAYNGNMVSVSRVSPALCYTSVADGSQHWVRSTSESGTLSPYQGIQFSKLPTPAGLAEGDYLVTPGVYSNITGKYFPVYAPLYLGQSVAATVTGNKIKFNGTQMPDVWATTIDVPEEIITNRKFEAKLTIEDRSAVPFTGKVSLCLYEPGKQVKRATLTTFVANVDGNSKLEVSVPATLQNVSLPEGTYEMYLLNSDNKRISDAVTVTVAVPADLGILTASNLTMVSTTPANLEVTVDIAASLGNWKGTVWLEVHNRGDYNSYLRRYPAKVDILSGKSTTLTLGGEFPEGIPGQYYTIYIYYTREGVEMEANGRQRKTFQLGENSAISEIEAGTGSAAELYDLSGRKVANPRRGSIYITNTGNKIIY